MSASRSQRSSCYMFWTNLVRWNSFSHTAFSENIRHVELPLGRGEDLHSVQSAFEAVSMQSNLT